MLHLYFLNNNNNNYYFFLCKYSNVMCYNTILLFYFFQCTNEKNINFSIKYILYIHLTSYIIIYIYIFIYFEGRIA